MCCNYLENRAKTCSLADFNEYEIIQQEVSNGHLTSLVVTGQLRLAGQPLTERMELKACVERDRDSEDEDVRDRAHPSRCALD